ncbi:MAG: NAD-dependent epimerase/dehydratase family protein [Candidatus Eisenbacteria bacterium]|uniref:NAD-dependent epimerase/dehydratase family protein n=1 Tax=Eiseniibacteriota bacterium TaxID=2212470 RepID=A0A933W826_UNCEI|nr:NAD-dependent epimerase/dehydratase family protein [Candidatus Eisenbacteria bacterium]
MDLLLLGGTRFFGRFLAESALARGHRVTLFHRGQTGAGLLPGAERILGDRDGGLGALAGRRWDAVVDFCGYVPRVVGDSCARLREAAGRYVFISSISVYAEPTPSRSREDAPRAVLADPSTEVIDGATYGGLKAACEDVVLGAFRDRATIVRPGLIVGPNDPTDRFPYWPRRIARGGEVLAPGDPAQPVQFIDARDLAAFTLQLAERDVAGTFHATGPDAPLSMGACLEGIRDAVGSDARFTWADEKFLIDRGVEPWTGLPLWIPVTEGGIQDLDIAAARETGLRFRPLAETARDTLAWDLARADESRAASPVLKTEREAELLAEWAAR